MTSFESVDLTVGQAATLVGRELTRAGEALGKDKLEPALDSYVRALGLALQLGPAPTEQVLIAVLQAASSLAPQQTRRSLSELGPALVGLVGQVREAGALPPTAVMEAWATVSADLGSLIGQVGLALDIAPDHREGMLDNVRARAAALDSATGALFDLAGWLEGIVAASKKGESL